MQNNTSNTTIPKVQRGIASLLLASQLLLTSCGGTQGSYFPAPESAFGASSRLLAEQTLPTEAVPTATSATKTIPYYNMAGIEGTIEIEDGDSYDHQTVGLWYYFSQALQK